MVCDAVDKVHVDRGIVVLSISVRKVTVVPIMPPAFFSFVVLVFSN